MVLTSATCASMISHGHRTQRITDAHCKAKGRRDEDKCIEATIADAGKGAWTPDDQRDEQGTAQDEHRSDSGEPNTQERQATNDAGTGKGVGSQYHQENGNDQAADRRTNIAGSSHLHQAARSAKEGVPVRAADAATPARNT